MKNRAQNAVERTQRKLAGVLDAEDLRGLQIRGNAHRVPVDIHGLVHEGSWPLQARRVELGLRRGEQIERLGDVDAHARGHFLRQRAYPQHVLGHIVMHLASFLDIEMQRGHLELFVVQDRLSFPQGPSEVVAIVIEIDVGILRGVEAAVLAIAEPLVHPADNVAGHVRVELITEDLVRVDVIL